MTAASSAAEATCPKHIQRQAARIGSQMCDIMRTTFKHTMQTYTSRYHPLTNLLPASGRHEAAVLQPMQATQHHDVNILHGVAILIREHPHLSSHLVQHSCGKLVLNAGAMQTVQQHRREWHVNCSIYRWQERKSKNGGMQICVPIALISAYAFLAVFRQKGVAGPADWRMGES